MKVIALKTENKLNVEDRSNLFLRSDEHAVALPILAIDILREMIDELSRDAVAKDLINKVINKATGDED